MDELVNYVTETPENTNPNVVRSLANQIPASGGAGGGGLKLNPVYDEESGFTLDKTAKEIADAFDEYGNVWWVKIIDNGRGFSGPEKYHIHAYMTNGTVYVFTAEPVYHPTSAASQIEYDIVAESLNDYPVYTPDD